MDVLDARARSGMERLEACGFEHCQPLGVVCCCQRGRPVSQRYRMSCAANAQPLGDRLLATGSESVCVVVRNFFLSSSSRCAEGLSLAGCDCCDMPTAPCRVLLLSPTSEGLNREEGAGRG